MSRASADNSNDVSHLIISQLLGTWKVFCVGVMSQCHSSLRVENKRLIISIYFFTWCWLKLILKVFYYHWVWPWCRCWRWKRQWTRRSSSSWPPSTGNLLRVWNSWVWTAWWYSRFFRIYEHLDVGSVVHGRSLK